MKAKEYREKSAPELEQELLALRKEQFNLRMQRGAENAKTHRFGEVRRDIARIKTVLNQKGNVNE